jgi:hypothetical protein
MTINLELYDDANTNGDFNAICVIPSGVDESINFDIDCSFSTSNLFYPEDNNNYDIKLLNKIIRYQENEDEEKSITIYINFNYLLTMTMHDCQLLKGICNNGNYNFNFSSCLLPDKSDINNNIEFILEIENYEESNCKIDKDNLNEIQCQIKNSELCKNIEDGTYIDITIGDTDPEIDSPKNFYISGLKNLFTTTLTGGLLDFGKCESYENGSVYTFSFINTQLTKALLNNTDFELQIVEPIKNNSVCTIPQNLIKFTLNCVIKSEKECPIIDKYSLKIKEIINEEMSDFLKPNTIYLKDFKNINSVLIKAGEITEGYCDNNNYLFTFVNSKIIGDITSKELDNIKNSQFSINLKNFEKSVLCNISDVDNESKQNILVICSFQGYGQCPMYNISYIEVEENDPDIDTKTIYPNILKFSDFKNKNLNFSNFYISLVNISNDICNQDKYEFVLNVAFISEDIPNYLSVNLNLTKSLEEDINANCILEKNNNKVNLVNIAKEGKIHCVIDEVLDDDNITLNMNYLYLENENKYLINLGEKNFDFGNEICPTFFSMIIILKLCQQKHPIFLLFLLLRLIVLI